MPITPNLSILPIYILLYTLGEQGEHIVINIVVSRVLLFTLGVHLLIFKVNKVNNFQFLQGEQNGHKVNTFLVEGEHLIFSNIPTFYSSVRPKSCNAFMLFPPFNTL